jgi:hypothetical protein
MPVGGANAHGVSVYTHATAFINTISAGTHITIRGGQDVLLHGATIAGGSVGANGTVWIGSGDATIDVSAGQRILVNTGLAASKSVTLTTTATPGAGDDGVAVRLTTLAGLTAAGKTSDGSGGLVKVDAVGHVELIGMVLAGGTVTQVFEAGVLKSETVTYSNELSTADLKAGGQLWLGGMTATKDGDLVEIGGNVRANQTIKLAGGSGRVVTVNGVTFNDGVGVKMPGGAHVATANANGEIVVISADDAELYGLLVAGGQIIDQLDAAGMVVGTLVKHGTGASRISITAEKQVRIGRDLYAGALIDMRGGTGSARADRAYADQGVVLFSTVHLKTGLENSAINLSASGNLKVLAPAWARQVVADAFTELATGEISADTSLALEIDMGTYKLRGVVTVTKASTVGNAGFTTLMDDLKNALYATQFTVADTTGQNGAPANGTKQTITSAVLGVEETNGRLMFTSDLEFAVLATGSVGADRLGFTQLASTARLTAVREYAIDASKQGSVVNLGKTGVVGGKITVNNWVVGHTAVNLNAGSAESNAAKDLELGVLGVIETRSGNIVFNPAGNSTLLGSLIAAGSNADVIINISIPGNKK